MLAEKKLYIATFGCQMNEYDSEKMALVLHESGYDLTPDMELADLILLNTCSIRDKAQQKVYSFLGRLHRLKEQKPELIIGVGGCVAQQEGVRLLKRVPHLDLVFGTHGIYRLPDLITRILVKGERVVDTDFHYSFPPPTTIKATRPRIKATVTIMQGCNNFCTYCIVPYVRGREISRPSRDILKEVTGLASSGVAEVTLLGQNVNSYGVEQPDSPSFPELLKQVDAVPNLLRLRFTTSHPKDLSAELIATYGTLKTLCEHIHLPVQTGSDRILRMMNRNYTIESYLNIIKALRRQFPTLAVTSDVIVGFPTETAADFDNTMALIEEIRFDSLFSFCYSDRPGTKATRLPDKVPFEEAARRLAILQDRQKEITLEKNQALEGGEVEVLVEALSKKSDSMLQGRTRSNKVVNFMGSPDLVGHTAMVKVLEGRPNSLLGRQVE
ncbi:MAG: tRNA (N6-isopentenyl adenosine(37)-C2)-methylthiotransferase MiaB [Deltaproteobacteria bacterium]|nr:tRNA (N6-isopentenyl adenosine(37)-C2)-methylthiotransferase MiaB [Deltaproteobacteria bacterium]